MRGKWVKSAATAALIAAMGASSAAFAQDADQGDTSATRGRINAGGSVTGAISPEGDKDWFRISVRPGQIYTFTLNGGEGDGALGDPHLALFDGDGVELASNDDYGGELNSRIDYVPGERGNIFVQASAFADSGTGAYTLAASAAALPADDAGNGRTTRASVTPGTDTSGNLEYAGDRDWYRLRVTEGQSYRVQLRAAVTEGDGALDPLLKLYDGEGVEIAMDDDGGGGLNSYLEYTAAADGDVFIEARGFMDDAVGEYLLTVGLGDIPGDASTDATISAEGDYRQGTLTPAGDRDWYGIELTEGQSVRIGLDGSEMGLGDPLLTIYDSESVQLAQDDDGGDGLNSRIEFTAPTTGTYFVEARGFLEDAEGQYAITVTPGEVGNSADTAEMLTPNTEGASSMISPAGDSDWYMIELVEGRPYRFNLTSEDTSSDLDPLLTLYNAEGVELVSDDDGGSGLNSYLTYTSVTGGTYFAAVSSFGGTGTGAYLLRASDTDVPGNIGTDELLIPVDGGDDRTSMIEIPGDTDFYRAELTVGVRYTISVTGTGENPLGDAFLTVLTSEGVELSNDDDSGPGLNAMLTFTPTATDSYYVRASGLGGSTGQYVISITPPAE